MLRTCALHAALLLLLSALPLAQRGVGDLVRLNSGEEIEGRVLLETAEGVLVRPERGKERLVPADEVAEVKSLERSLARLLERLDDLGDLDDLDGVGELDEVADQAEGAGLGGLAHLLRWKQVLIDPLHRPALEALGARRHERRWWFEAFGKRLSLSELQRRRRSWDTPWIFRTAHYRIRTNVELSEVVDVALDLERFYLAFREHLGTPIGLRVPLEPMDVNLHGDSRSFPKVPDGRTAWYDRGQHHVSIQAALGPSRAAVFHEAVHLVLNDRQVSRSGTRGVFPAWVEEGLAEYVAAAAFGEEGRMRFDWGDTQRDHYRLQLESRKRTDLRDLFKLTYGDFADGKRSPLHYARSYTLVDYLLHGEGEALRAGFLEFLAEVRQGRTTVKALESCLDTKRRRVESGWKDQIKRLGAN